MTQTNPALNAFGDEHLIGGNYDPRIVATLAPRGTVFILARAAGQVTVLQKQDAGKTKNWTEVGAGAISWVAAIEITFGNDGVHDIWLPQSADRIIGVKAFVETAFDGAGPTLKVGLESEADDKYMLATKNDLTTIGTYETHPLENPTDDKKVQATIADGASTAGSVIVAVQKLIITGAML